MPGTPDEEVPSGSLVPMEDACLRTSRCTGTSQTICAPRSRRTPSPDVKLPTEGELSEEYEASRNTVREAIRRLTDEGLLESRPGRARSWPRRLIHSSRSSPPTRKPGSAAARPLRTYPRFARSTGMPRSTVPRVEVVTASDAVAGLLDIPLESQVVSRSQNRYIDGIPWSMQTSFYLMDFITKGATKLLMALDIEEGSVPYLDSEIGVRQTCYRDWITGRLATEEEQAFFGIGHNAAVFVDSRVAFDQGNIPMRLTVTIFPVDRNQLIVNVGPNVPTLADNDKRLGKNDSWG